MEQSIKFDTSPDTKAEPSNDKILKGDNKFLVMNPCSSTKQLLMKEIEAPESTNTVLINPAASFPTLPDP
jgi:hypothetical protein